MQVNKIYGYSREFSRKVFETENGTLERIRLYSNGKLKNTLLVDCPKGIQEQVSDYFLTGTSVIKRFKNGKLVSKTVLVGDGNKSAQNSFYHARFNDAGNAQVQAYLDARV